MLALSMDDEIERRLEALGARTRTTKTELARRKLLEALEEELRDLRDTGETSAPQVRAPGARARSGTGEDLLRVLGEIRLAESTLDAIEDVVRSRSQSPVRVVDLG